MFVTVHGHRQQIGLLIYQLNLSGSPCLSWKCKFRWVVALSPTRMLYGKMPYLVDYLMNISETVKMKKYKVIEMKLPTDIFFFPIIDF